MSPGLGALWESAINNAAQQLTLMARHLPTERNRLVGLQSLAVRARYLLAPLPVCEITPLASPVAFELLVPSVGKRSRDSSSH
jgi:hypothetical protein